MAGRFRGPAALCLAVVLAAGLAGCRPRAVADHQLPAIPPASAGGAGTSTGSADPAPAPAVGQQDVGQQDVNNLNGILTSVGGAVTSLQSAIAGDGPTPKG